MHWHAWVNKVSKREFSDYRRIVSSFPGRQPFYPYASEFLPHPQWLLDVLTSPRDYITDYWVDGLPTGNVLRKTKFWGILPTFRHETVQPAEHPPDVEPIVSALLKEYQQVLPKDTRFFIPFRVNHYQPDGIDFGYSVSRDRHNELLFRDLRIPFKAQVFEQLRPTPRGTTALSPLVPNDEPLICIFPRNRVVRRPDKNWSRDRYLELFGLLRDRFPTATLAILGAPNEAHFDDGVPAGCLDLINVPTEIRMDIQVAALNRSIGALESLSGAMLVALAAGAPSVTWSWSRHERRYYGENLLNTPTAYVPSENPKPQRVSDVFNDLISGGKPYQLRRFVADKVGSTRSTLSKAFSKPSNRNS